MIFKKHVNKMLSWQQKRAGLMHHVMSQKMGLFYHTNASDIAPITSVSGELELSLKQTDYIILYDNFRKPEVTAELFKMLGCWLNVPLLPAKRYNSL